MEFIQKGTYTIQNIFLKKYFSLGCFKWSKEQKRIGTCDNMGCPPGLSCPHLSQQVRSGKHPFTALYTHMHMHMHTYTHMHTHAHMHHTQPAGN